MFQYVAFTNGTTILDLTDNINHALVSYAPSVAPYRDNDLGSPGPFNRVVDSITFHALGCTAAEAYAAAAAVSAMLDQARLWARGDLVNPVRLLVQAQGTALDTLEAYVLGRPPGGAPNATLPAVFNAHFDKFVISDITIQFARLGRFLLPHETYTGAQAAQAIPTVRTLTFADHSILSPLYTDWQTVKPVGRGTALAVFAPAIGLSSGIVIYEAESGTLGANVTSVADAANSARGGSIARYTAPAGLNTDTITIQALGINGDARRLFVLLAYRKNQTAAIYDITTALYNATSLLSIASTATQRITTSSTNPQLLLLGPIIVHEPVQWLQISIDPVSGVVATNTFDIDYAAVIMADDERSSILSIDLNILNADETLGIYPLPGAPVTSQDFPLGGPVPQVYALNTSLSHSYGYAGDAGNINIQGTSTNAALFATGNTAAPNRWRLYDTVGGAVVTIGIIAYRRKAYVVPS